MAKNLEKYKIEYVNKRDAENTSKFHKDNPDLKGLMSLIAFGPVDYYAYDKSKYSSYKDYVEDYYKTNYERYKKEET